MYVRVITKTEQNYVVKKSRRMLEALKKDVAGKNWSFLRHGELL